MKSRSHGFKSSGRLRTSTPNGLAITLTVPSSRFRMPITNQSNVNCTVVNVDSALYEVKDPSLVLVLQWQDGHKPGQSVDGIAHLGQISFAALDLVLDVLRDISSVHVALRANI